MKDYIVKAIINFNDTVEKNERGLDTPRMAQVSVWNCTKERYEYLKEHSAVILVGIEGKDKVKEAKVEEPTEELLEKVEEKETIINKVVKNKKNKKK